MKKKMLKRSLALGALMAFVITGSAMAAESTKVDIRDGKTYDFEHVNITVPAVSAGGGSTVIGGYVTGEGSVANLKGNTVSLDIESGAKVEGFRVDVKGTLNLGNIDITDRIDIDAKSTEGNVLGIFVRAAGAKVNINTETLNINVSDDLEGYPQSFAIRAQSSTEYVEGLGENAGAIKINAENINITSTGSGIGAFSNGQVDINGNLVVNAVNVIDTRGNSTINVNIDGKHTTVLNGDVVFETPNSEKDPAGSGRLLNSYVNINLDGEGSSWTGKSYLYYQKQDENGKWNYVVDSTLGSKGDHYGEVTGFKLDIANGASWNMTGNSFINDLGLAEGGAVNIQDSVDEFNAAVVEMNGGIVNMEGSNTVVNIGELKGNNAVVSTSSLDNEVIITTNNNKNVTVNGNGDIADQIAADKDNANKLAGVVTDGNNNTVADKITTDEGVIGGRFEGVVDDDGTVTGSQFQNTSNVGISEMGSIALMAWRAENNDMNKRLGELRDSNGEHGIWTRMTRGESEFKSIKNQYNSYQIGYDEQLSTDKSWTVGAAFTYTDAESSFAQGSGENTHKGFALYGSKLNEDGSYIDLIAKYARLEHEFETVSGIGKGEYDTNGYSVSAEYGKRFEQGNGVWFEPQVELTYGTVDDVTYQTEKAVAYQDKMDSLVGRVGFRVGKDIKDGNIYARASYLYDFDGETQVTMSNGKASETYEQDLGGGWFEVGVGTNINLSDATYVYLDVEKTYGGDVATPWQWNAGVRYSF